MRENDINFIRISAINKQGESNVGKTLSPAAGLLLLHVVDQLLVACWFNWINFGEECDVFAGSDWRFRFFFFALEPSTLSIDALYFYSCAIWVSNAPYTVTDCPFFHNLADDVSIHTIFDGHVCTRNSTVGFKAEWYWTKYDRTTELCRD